MASRSASDAARIKLNLKNLRRHDETITEIVESTSYVVMYLMEQDRSWVKSNIEGPMFLFKRSVQPFYGFFVLNRQGLEYFQEDLTPECSVELMGDFIAFEAASANKIHGIWCYEPEARKSMCRKMEELRALSVMSPTLHPRLLPYNQSIPIDLLFASPIPAAQTLPTAAQRLPTALSSNKPQHTGLKLLDSIFASANAVLPSQAQLASSAVPTSSQRQVSANLNSNPLPPAQLSARSLLAMIGHPNGTSPVRTQPTPSSAATPISTPPRPKPISPTQTRTKSMFTPPLLSHDLFDKYPLPTPLKKIVPPPPVPVIPSPKIVPTTSTPVAPAMTPSASGGGPGKGTGGARGLGAKIMKENLGIAFMDRSGSPSLERSRLGDGSVSKSGKTTPSIAKDGLNGEERILAVLKKGLEGHGLGGNAEVPLDKSEFVRSVLSLVYTSKFSNALYEDYLGRFERSN